MNFRWLYTRLRVFQSPSPLQPLVSFTTSSTSWAAFLSLRISLFKHFWRYNWNSKSCDLTTLSYASDYMVLLCVTYFAFAHEHSVTRCRCEQVLFSFILFCLSIARLNYTNHNGSFYGKSRNLLIILDCYFSWCPDPIVVELLVTTLFTIPWSAFMCVSNFLHHENRTSQLDVVHS